MNEEIDHKSPFYQDGDYGTCCRCTIIYPPGTKHQRYLSILAIILFHIIFSAIFIPTIIIYSNDEMKSKILYVFLGLGYWIIGGNVWCILLAEHGFLDKRNLIVYRCL